MIGDSPDTDTIFLGLLGEVCSAPDDDIPRLVLADWLEEHGQSERAEFVRVQCELAAAVPPVGVKDRPTDLLGGQGRVFHKRGRESAWGKRQAFLRRRERELWGMSLGWTWPFEGAINWFSRGFASSLTCTAADWLAHADALAWHQDHSTAACPPTAQPITKVVLTTVPDFHFDDYPWATNNSRRVYTHRRVARWGHRTTTAVVEVTERELALGRGGNTRELAAAARDQLAAQLTPTIVLKEWWPWIAFEVATLHPRPLDRRPGESEDDHAQRVGAFNDQVGST